jgi:hypothetical protein
MTTILVDGIKAVSLQNGIVRIDCVGGGPNNEERLSGTLLVPANRVGQVLGGLTQALQELEKKIREQQSQNLPTAGSA